MLIASAISFSGGAKSLAVPDNKLRARSTSPELHVRRPGPS
jgi:hypothetical protein